MRITIARLLAGTLAIAAILIFGLGSASAADKRYFWISSTADLLELCKTPQDDPVRAQAANYCMAYVDGAVDYHDAIADHKEMKRVICYPDTATLEEGVLVFVNWAERNQGNKKLMEEATILGVVKALEDKWPCT